MLTPIFLLFAFMCSAQVKQQHQFMANENFLSSLLPSRSYATNIMRSTPAAKEEETMANNKNDGGRLRARVFSTCTMNIPIAMGTPSRLYNLSVNFISAHVLLMRQSIPYHHSSPSNPKAYKRQIYVSSESSTFVDLKRNYTQPLLWEGMVVSDAISFPPGTIPVELPKNTTLGFVWITALSGLFRAGMISVPTDGFLGLSPQRRTREGTDAFMTTLAASMEMPLITMHFKKFNAFDPDMEKQNSEAIFGFGKDTLNDLCNASSWFHMPIQSPDYWQISMASAHIGKKLFAQNQVAYIEPASGFYIRVPKMEMKVLGKLLGATENFAGVYECPCNVTMRAPTITLALTAEGTRTKFANKQQQQQQKQVYSVEFQPNEYILPVTPPGLSVCRLIFSTGYEYWELGYAFFNQNCLSLKYGKDKMEAGLAKTKF